MSETEAAGRPAFLASIATHYSVLNQQRATGKVHGQSLDIRSEDEAQTIQDLTASSFGQPTVGWKLGGLDDSSRQRLGLTRPFIGRVFASRLLYGADVPADYVATGDVHVETEVAFRLSRDLPHQGTPYSLSDVKRSIDSVALALEIVCPRQGRLRGLSGLEIVADNGCCDGLVVGGLKTDWEVLDARTLRFDLAIDGVIKAVGNVTVTTDELLHRVLWLVNFLSERRIGMNAYQYVATGTWTGLQPVQAGSVVTASCSQLGAVSLRVMH